MSKLIGTKLRCVKVLEEAKRRSEVTDGDALTEGRVYTLIRGNYYLCIIGDNGVKFASFENDHDGGIDEIIKYYIDLGLAVFEEVKEEDGMNTAEMWLKAQVDGLTYITGNVLYNKERGFHSSLRGSTWNASSFEKYEDDNGKRDLEAFMHLSDWKEHYLSIKDLKVGEKYKAYHKNSDDTNLIVEVDELGTVNCTLNGEPHRLSYNLAITSKYYKLQGE